MSDPAGGGRASRPGPHKLLETPGALLTTSDLFALGLDQRAVDATFRRCGVVKLPGYARPLVRAADVRDSRASNDRNHLPPAGFLTRSDVAAFGLERRAIDALFEHLPVVRLPGYRRPLIRSDDLRELLEQCTYNGDRVRPTR